MFSFFVEAIEPDHSLDMVFVRFGTLDLMFIVFVNPQRCFVVKFSELGTIHNMAITIYLFVMKSNPLHAIPL